MLCKWFNSFVSAFVILGTCQLFIANDSAHAKTHKNKRGAQGQVSNSNQAPFLTLDEIRRLTPQQQFQYFRAMQNFIEVAESISEKSARVNGARGKSTSWLESILPLAYAAQMKNCVIGGYISNWRKKPNGNFSCARHGDQEGSCGGGENRIQCNPLVYGFADDSGAPVCVTLSPYLSRDCAKSFNARYDSGNNLPKMTDDIEKMAQNNPEGFKDHLRRLIDLKLEIETLKRNGQLDKTQEVAIHEALKAIEPFMAAARRSPTADKLVNTVLEERPVAGHDPDIGLSTGSGSARVDSSKPPVYSMQCVYEGLKSTPGHEKVSPRYLALIGVAVQSSQDGPYDMNSEASRQAFHQRAIQLVQAYGYCDEDIYGGPLQDNDTKLLRLWLTDNGRRHPGAQGKAYLDKLAKEYGTDAVSAMNQVFGIGQLDTIQTRSSGLFGGNKVKDELSPMSVLFPSSSSEWNEWERQSAFTRQSRMFESYDKLNQSRISKPFDACVRDLRRRTLSDLHSPAFALRYTPGGSHYKSKNDDESTKIQTANLNLCQAMSSSCGLNSDFCKQGLSLPSKTAPAQPASGQPTTR